MSDPVKYITDEGGERTAVVIPISDYEKLLEDLEDLAVVAERRDEPTIPHEQFVSELKRDGLI
jgi:PHD/YefM family antitoxin component YafN of YafNO toxin-antitoxin module